MFKENKNRGFTIIEVALVLAISGLIFLVVFLAVPAMQRAQRDDSRKRDVSSVGEAVAAWVADHPREIIPPNATLNFYRQVNAGNTSSDHSFGDYIGNLSILTNNINVHGHKVVVAPDGEGTIADLIPMVWPGSIDIYFGYRCMDNKHLQKGTSRNAVVVTQIEAGNPYFNQKNGQHKEQRNYYCMDVL